VFVTTRPPGSLPEAVHVSECLPGVEVFHATPKELAPWFTVESTDGRMKQQGRRNTDRLDGGGNSDSTPAPQDIQGRLVALSGSPPQESVQREEPS